MNHILRLYHPKIFKRIRVLKKQFSKNTTLLVSTSFSPSVLHLQLVSHATPPLRERVWCKGKPARTSGIPAGQSDPFCHMNLVSTAHFFCIISGSSPSICSQSGKNGCQNLQLISSMRKYYHPFYCTCLPKPLHQFHQTLSEGVWHA